MTSSSMKAASPLARLSLLAALLAPVLGVKQDVFALRDVAQEATELGLDVVSNGTLLEEALQKTPRDAEVREKQVPKVNASCTGEASSLDQAVVVGPLGLDFDIPAMLESVAQSCASSFNGAVDMASHWRDVITENLFAASGSAREALAYFRRFAPAAFRAAMSFGTVLSRFWSALPHVKKVSDKVDEIIRANPDLFTGYGKIRKDAIAKHDQGSTFAGPMMMLGFWVKAGSDAIRISLSEDGWAIFQEAARFLADLIGPMADLGRDLIEARAQWIGVAESLYNMLDKLGLTVVADWARPVLAWLRSFFEGSARDVTNEAGRSTGVRATSYLAKMQQVANYLTKLSNVEALTTGWLEKFRGAIDGFKENVWRPLSDFVYNAYTSVSLGFEHWWASLGRVFGWFKDKVQDMIPSRSNYSEALETVEPVDASLGNPAAGLD